MINSKDLLFLVVLVVLHSEHLTIRLPSSLSSSIVDSAYHINLVIRVSTSEENLLGMPTMFLQTPCVYKCVCALKFI